MVRVSLDWEHLMVVSRICGLMLALVAYCQPHLSLAQDYRYQCVPYARALSSISLWGDAWRWWSEASRRYQRGSLPQAGGILSFRPNVRMPLGHLAVVTRVVSSREIEVDHANWAVPGTINHGVQVLDVSFDNDWTEVRVELRERDHFGAAYATDGFIYGHPVEIGPQIVNIAQALKALSTTASSPPSHQEGLPIVLEGGGMEQSANTERGHGASPTLPVVVYGSGRPRAR